MYSFMNTCLFFNKYDELSILNLDSGNPAKADTSAVGAINRPYS